MKSFDDVLNVLANSHYDMRVLVSKWQEMLNSEPATVVFQFFDGTEFEIENFASIEKSVRDAISNYGNVALLSTAGNRDQYNGGRLLIGDEHGPYTVYRWDQIQGYGQKVGQNPHGKPGNFGLNVAQVWGNSLPTDTPDIGRIAEGDMWGLDASRVQGEKFEITGDPNLKNRNQNTNGVWISSNGLHLVAGDDTTKVAVDHNGVRGVTETGAPWEYGVDKSNYLKYMTEQYRPGTFTKSDGISDCIKEQAQINQLQNVQVFHLNIKLNKLSANAPLSKVGDLQSLLKTDMSKNTTEYKVMIPNIFFSPDGSPNNIRIVGATVFTQYTESNKNFNGSVSVCFSYSIADNSAAVEMVLSRPGLSSSTPINDVYNAEYLFLQYVAFDNPKKVP
jgi:hypothetical protein